MTTVYKTAQGKDVRDVPPGTFLFIPPVAPPVVPVNTIQLVALPANAGEGVVRTIAWGAGWTGVTNGVSTFVVNVYQFGAFFDDFGPFVVANFPGGNLPNGVTWGSPIDLGGPGTYKWGIIVTNAAGPSLEYQTTDSIVT